MKILMENFKWCKSNLVRCKSELINRKILKPMMKYCLYLGLGVTVIGYLGK